MNNRDSEIHVIFGAGQIGTKLAQRLGAGGYTVRLVRRSEPGAAMPGVTWMQGDATDVAFTDRVCEGAAVVYCTANPPDYHRWDGVLQPLFRAIWAAAAKAEARLVQLDNLYMYGRPEQGRPLSESTPMRPCSDKGRLRAELAQELLDAHHSGTLRVDIARASDFFGPHTPSAAVFRPDTMEAIATGGSVFITGDPDMPHSYAYTPDVARGLAILGTQGKGEGKVWHLPVAAAQLSTRELIERLAAELGTRPKVRTIPNWALAVAGVFVPLMRALPEMSYQWETPFTVDDSAFVQAFGVEATPLEEAIRATMQPHRDDVQAAA